MRDCLSQKLLNEVLFKITGKQDYRFNLKAIMVNENGADFCGIKDMFGLNVMRLKVASCQMKFQNDVHETLVKLGGRFKEEFKEI